MDEPREAMERLMVCLNKIDGLYYMSAKRRGINENALCVLYALDDGKPHSQKQICEEWLIPKTTVNTIIREWQKEGIIVLIPENRRREKNICLTDKGRAWAKELLDPVYQAEQAAMARTVQEFSPRIYPRSGAFLRVSPGRLRAALLNDYKFDGKQ